DVLPVDRDPRPPRAGRRRLAHRARRPREPCAQGLELVGRLGDVHPLLVLRLRAVGRAVPAGLHLLTEVIVTRRRIYSTLLAAAALCAAVFPVLAPDAFAQGCAMCGTAFIKDDPVTRAFNWSVLFLIAMPYTIFGLAAGW